MTKLYIEEWGNIPVDNKRNLVPVPHELIAQTQLDIGASSNRTSFAFDSRTNYVILYAASEAFVSFGDNSVTATTNGIIMPKGAFRSFGLSNDWKYVAVIGV